MTLLWYIAFYIPNVPPSLAIILSLDNISHNFDLVCPLSIDNITPYLYFSTRRQVMKVDVRHGSSHLTVLDGLSSAIGIDFDWSEQRLYFSDVTKDKIIRCYLNGSECEDVITTGLSMTEGE